MPVQTEGFRLFTAETLSTYPQNVAYKAAELTAQTWRRAACDASARPPPLRRARLVDTRS